MQAAAEDKRLVRARAYITVEQFDDAKATLRDILRDNPNDVAALMLLAEVSRIDGDDIAARAYEAQARLVESQSAVPVQQQAAPASAPDPAPAPAEDTVARTEPKSAARPAPRQEPMAEPEPESINIRHRLGFLVSRSAHFG